MLHVVRHEDHVFREGMRSNQSVDLPNGLSAICKHGTDDSEARGGGPVEGQDRDATAKSIHEAVEALRLSSFSSETEFGNSQRADCQFGGAPREEAGSDIANASERIADRVSIQHVAIGHRRPLANSVTST